MKDTKWLGYVHHGVSLGRQTHANAEESTHWPAPVKQEYIESERLRKKGVYNEYDIYPLSMCHGLTQTSLSDVVLIDLAAWISVDIIICWLHTNQNDTHPC
jgi:hypothetical protein